MHHADISTIYGDTIINHRSTKCVRQTVCVHPDSVIHFLHSLTGTEKSTSLQLDAPEES